MRFAFANISGHLGLLLLPDEWNPEVYLLNDVNNTESVFSSNEITLDDWDVLESNGVVFLPAAGLRVYGNATGYVNEAGYYWTATLDDTFYKPINLRFGNNHSDNNRSSGNSVRLLCYSSALVEEVTVTTQPNVICTPTSIQGGGSVIVPDGVVVSDKGLCYSLNANPTMSDGYVSADMGSGVFTATITNLTPSTSYHIRAYAITDNGVYYGSDLMAMTMEADNVPEGAINGKFSVDATHKVYFSQGNLQYKATTNTWRFAENQWDAMGSQNQFIAENYDGWIDLFGWGTSGYNHGAVCYQPWSVTQSNTDYMAYGDLNADLYDGDGTADWGYNVISNGGGEENLWRTLTADEFYYLLQDRPGVRYARATVNDVAGLILLPDNWSTSVYSFNEPNVYDAAFNSNVISSDTWLLLEGNGAVFLPIAGERNFTSVNTNNGAYWSSQAGVEALYLAIDNYCTGVNGMSRYRGFSVRLVRNVE